MSNECDDTKFKSLINDHNWEEKHRKEKPLE